MPKYGLNIIGIILLFVIPVALFYSTILASVLPPIAWFIIYPGVQVILLILSRPGKGNRFWFVTHLVLFILVILGFLLMEAMFSGPYKDKAFIIPTLLQDPRIFS